jgi:hypothetical protein
MESIGLHGHKLIAIINRVYVIILVKIAFEFTKPCCMDVV